MNDKPDSNETTYIGCIVRDETGKRVLDNPPPEEKRDRSFLHPTGNRRSVREQEFGGVEYP